ncbi:predicted membrane protein/domain [Microbacterium testaceum StLB037]|uniref:Predicted membrane protein/domain n=1 Tax=Microbacterium testaceum (strain StLB037) TaxID=979556 RepID=E8NBP5_MICTS|nr:RDD family protein [Microbacterium testaceum]BAJ73505.1 predicted membrane protein/domain [Microbacterium testaceum StLB037]
MASSAASPRSEVRTPAARGVTLIDIASEEILTGEAVALDVQPLGFFLRALGCLIDMVVGVVLLIGGGLLLVTMAASGALPDSALRIGIITLIVLVMVVLPTTVETLSRGRSLGRLAVGGRIVRVDGGAAGFRAALIRALVGVLELWLTLGGIAAVVGMFTPRAQRLGDLVAGTASERTRTRPLPPPAPGLPPGWESWAQVADVSRLPDRLAARVSQFVRGAELLDPAARVRIAGSLADAVAPFVSPRPPADPEAFVRAVASVRRDREYRALVIERERAASLTGR